MTWHVDTALLRAYRSEALSDASMASVEVHMTACSQCRLLVAANAGAATEAARQRVKQAVGERLDAPPLGRLERGLRRAGVRDADARLLTATLSLHGSWLAAWALALAFGLVATMTGPEGTALALFLVAAPLVPLAGVALAYGPRVDPTHEIAVAASIPTARVILLRALAVATPALPALMAASFVLPGGLLAFAWLLPAIGLTAAGLALGTLMPLSRAAVSVALVWAIGAAVGFAEAPRSGAEAFVRSFAAFRPSGQLVSAAVGAASLVLLALRRAEFETAR